jgi:hypothetical protein
MYSYSHVSNTLLGTPKFLDGFNYESKGEDNKKRSWGVLSGL